MTAQAEVPRLVLFVAADAPKAMVAIENIKRAIAGFRSGAFALEIVNVFEDSQRALDDRVFVTPTLLAPSVSRRLVGDLSETSQLTYFLRSLSCE